jgi:transposase-like protein
MTKTTESQWRRLIAEQEASGLTVREFAACRGLSASTIYWWRSRLHREGRSVAELVPVEVTEAPAAASTAIERIVGDDIVLRLPRGFDEADLRRVLAVVGKCVACRPRCACILHAARPTCGSPSMGFRRWSRQTPSLNSHAKPVLLPELDVLVARAWLDT